MKLFAPLINDIATDLGDPPTFSTGDDGISSGASDKIRKHYSDLEPLRLPIDAEAAYRTVLTAAERMERWKLTIIDRENLILEGFALTNLLRFRDDFIIRVRAAGTGSIIDMRSRSRTGRADFGANATRIRTFFHRLRHPPP